MIKNKKLKIYIEELFYSLAEALQHNPNFWEKILPSPKEFAETLLERNKDRILNSPPEEAKAIVKSLFTFTRIHYHMEAYLKTQLKKYLTQDDPFQAMLDDKQWGNGYHLFVLLVTTVKLSRLDLDHFLAVEFDPIQMYEHDWPHWEDYPVHQELISTFYADYFPKKVEPGLRMFLDPQFKDGTIVAGLNILLDISHERKPTREEPFWKNAYSNENWILKLKGHTDGRLHISVNLSASKSRIRTAVRELLKELGPRDTVPTPKFSPETWELSYEIYVLRQEERLKFAEIASRVGKSEDWVEELHKEIWEYLHQPEKYGTVRSRGETHVPITEKTHMSLEDAENIHARMQIVGPGGKQTPRQMWDDQQGSIFSTSPSEEDKVLTTTFDNWCKRTGNTNSCMEFRGKRAKGWVKHEEDCDKCPHFFFDSYISEPPKKTAKDHEIVRCSGPESRRSENGYTQCKFDRGHPRCLTCTQTPPPSTYTTGQVEPDVTYVKRSPIPPTHPCTGKVVIRVKESEFKTPYPPKYSEDPPKFVKITEYMRFHDEFGMTRAQDLEIQAECISEHGVITCPPQEAPELVDHEIKEKDKIRNIASGGTGQYSLAFTLPKDQLESLLINKIDHRAKITNP